MFFYTAKERLIVRMHVSDHTWDTRHTGMVLALPWHLVYCINLCKVRCCAEGLNVSSKVENVDYQQRYILSGDYRLEVLLDTFVFQDHHKGIPGGK